MPDDLTDETAAAAKARRDRVFLVVVDDSPERGVALRYAALRTKKSGGRVALLRVVEPAGQVEWAGVGALMAEERRRRRRSCCPPWRRRCTTSPAACPSC
jgi:hypothetical protein